MELRHVRYFVAVAESLNFGRAAAQLRIAQPSLSHQIRQLEAELHAKLLARTTRRVELTEAGRLFLEEAREILAHADRAAVVARRAGQSGLGTLRIGWASWMDARLIVASMRAFRARQPAVHFDLQTMSEPLQLTALRDQRLDVAFVRPPVGGDPLASSVVLSEPLALALPSSHRLTRRGRVPLSALAAERFVLPPRVVVPIFHDLLLKACRAAGFVPTLAHEIDEPRMLLALVASGAGVSLVPASLRSARPQGVAIRPVAPAPPILKTVLAWRDQPTPVVSEFVETVRRLWPGER